MENIQKLHAELHDFFMVAYKKMNIEELQSKQVKLQEEVNSPTFWKDNDQAKAQAKSKELAGLDLIVSPWQKLKQELEEVREYIDLDDDSIVDEISLRLQVAGGDFAKLKGSLRFSGKHDKTNAVMTISAGAGGLDAQDWAAMLLRMYLRWADKEGLSVDVHEESHGDEGGVKSASLSFSGQFAYGKLKGENGVHRLVRLSPFNSAHSRETSFAMVEIIPETDSPDEIEIQETDLRVDVYRAGGKGGQSVNTTDSAVRITHLPTGVVVSIQNERSQLQNKETALKILKSRLAKLAEEQHMEDVRELKGPNMEAAWGNQIRSYVLHPYTMVKDTRSGFQLTDVQKVLDGELNELIDDCLEQAMGQS